MLASIKDECSIVGIGMTEISKFSGRSELQLAAECVKAAIEDAGLKPTDIDGMTGFTLDHVDEIEVARAVGIPELKLLSRMPHGGGAPMSLVHQAAMAVATGMCKAVVGYRAMNGRSGARYSSGVAEGPETTDRISWGWYMPYGLLTPACWVAMHTMRYLHEYGATTEDFGRVSVATRKHAATNPCAWFYQQPITLGDHQGSRWIIEPLRLLDCCQESDGSVAVVVTSLERARDLRQKPAVIAAAAQGATHEQQMMTGYYADDIAGLPEMGLVARQLFETAGIGPEDVQTAVIYDHFTPFVLTQLEEFGFCGRGEAKDFVKDGNIELGGGLPINPNGGQLGEAYIHGMNGIAEAVRQVRGDAVNQVPDAMNVLVTAGTAVPTSAAILSGDR